MKTPMQELIEQMWEIAKYGDSYEVAPCIEAAEAMREKEKEAMVDFAYKCRNVMAGDEFAISHWYDKTFNNKEK